MQRFLDAGFELLARAESGKEFTVQEVVDRSGQSLRSFYQYFAGKHELLLALFDEAILSTADRLEEQLARQDTPLERLHTFVVEYYRMCLPAPKGRRLEEQSHPGHGGVLSPAAHRPSNGSVPRLRSPRDPAGNVLDDAAQSGDVPKGLNHAEVAGVILSTIMFNAAYAHTISGSERP